MALHAVDRPLYESIVESQKSIAKSLELLTAQMVELMKPKEVDNSKDELLKELISAVKNIKLESVVNNVSAEPAKAVAKAPVKKAVKK